MNTLLLVFAVVLFVVGETYCSDHIQILEGKNCSYQCKGQVTPETTIYWESISHGFYQDGAGLWISNISRNRTGEYDCMEKNKSTNKTKELDSVFIDVIYPAKILSTNITKQRLNENEAFYMTATVEGRPPPVTSLTQFTSGNTKFSSNESGTLMITFNASCDDRDLYFLTCGNSIGTDQQSFNLTVLCAPVPDPAFHYNQTVTPRLGETILFEARVKGFPPPTFHWWQAGKELSTHTDTEYSSKLTISPVRVENYGAVILNISNEAGASMIQYNVLAEGPPEPVTDFQVKNVSCNSAVLKWTTGFDYNSTQTFVVLNFENGNAYELKSYPDRPNDPGNIAREETLPNLESIKEYNITIIARNNYGNASHTSTSTAFETYGLPRPSVPPKDTFSPRLGENIELRISSISNPPPTFTWTLNDQSVEHKDTEQSSTVYLNGLNPGDFGTYVLTMTNFCGAYTQHFAVNAEGPPEPVTNFQVKSFNTNSAILEWTTGFDYNSTQTFVVVNYENGVSKEIQSFPDKQNDLGGNEKEENLLNLTPINQYNITIIARNSRGDAVCSTPRNFVTLGAPMPASPPQDKFSPRIGDNIVLSISSVGNPPPTFTWTLNDRQIDHSDKEQSSVVYLNGIKPEDFGSYLLDMKNSVGEYTHQFTVSADGPPDVATDLEVGQDVTFSSAEISWFPGFDYGDVQTFTVVNEDGGVLGTVTGKLGDMEKVNYTILELNPGTDYSVQIESSNSRGNATTLSNAVKFTTGVRNTAPRSTRTGNCWGIFVLLLVLLFTKSVFLC